jgi:hypothetical protein
LRRQRESLLRKNNFEIFFEKSINKKYIYDFFVLMIHGDDDAAAALSFSTFLRLQLIF